MTDEEFYARRLELLSRNVSPHDPEWIHLNEEREQSKYSETTKSSQPKSAISTTSQNQTSFISEEEFFERRLKLLANNISDTDPEMQELYKQRALSQKYYSESEVSSSSEIDFNNNPIQTQKAHIIIKKGNYFLLDSNLQTIDSVYTNPLSNFITRKHNLRIFKQQLNSDFNNYKVQCKEAGISMNSDFVEMHKLIKWYLKLCPDADYNILELIRQNFHNIDSSYINYQSMCAEYLHELAKKTHGNLDNMPFGIYFFTDYYVTSDHKYIAYQFDECTNPVEAFRDIYYSKNGRPDCFEAYRCYEAIGKYNPQFTHVKHIKTPSIQER